jgi:hypothetical protein
MSKETYSYVDHNGNEVSVPFVGGLERKQQIMELCKAAFKVDSYYDRHANDMMIFVTAALLHDQCFRMKQVDVARLLSLRDTEGFYYINKGRMFLQIPAIRISVKLLADKMGVGLIMSEVQEPDAFTTRGIPQHALDAKRAKKEAKRLGALERKNKILKSIQDLRKEGKGLAPEDEDAD